ncbi:Epoxide hydrolase 1 [Halotydeus destructor]|nr:Epoxide hydrolase 1 [Halotydeus destructor]
MDNLLLLAAASLGVIVIFSLWPRKPKRVKIPDEIYQHHYWGPNEVVGQPPADNPSIDELIIGIPEDVLGDLRSRLMKTRITESYKETNFQYGFHSGELKKVIKYWLTKYDWKKQENDLNKFDHFQTEIEGLKIHFIHQRASQEATKVHTVLLAHGWPGSFIEFIDMIPLLTSPVGGVAFNVIVPSIPGFGSSDPPCKPGLNNIHTARIYSQLMTRLGYEKFYHLGNDWGCSIGRAIGVLYPSRLLGLHITLPGGGQSLKNIIRTLIGYWVPRLVFDNPQLDQAMIYPWWQKSLWDTLQESGYAHIQATKPDTLGVALTDSPAGLAAYMLEKFSTWVHKDNVNLQDGGLTQKFTYDQLLTNVMIYWSSGNITTSMRFYKEFFKGSYGLKTDSVPLDTPTGISAFPQELAIQPKKYLEGAYGNIVHYSYMPRGGHFSAFEEPQLLADDFRLFVTKTLKSA